MRLSTAHILAICTWVTRRASPRDEIASGGRWLPLASSLPALAALFDAANAAAFSDRYSERETPRRASCWKPIKAAEEIMPGQVWTLLDCLEYNCDEAPDWAACEALQAVKICRGIIAQSLPGMVGARWSINTPEDCAHLARPIGSPAAPVAPAAAPTPAAPANPAHSPLLVVVQPLERAHPLEGWAARAVESEPAFLALAEKLAETLIGVTVTPPSTTAAAIQLLQRLMRAEVALVGLHEYQAQGATWPDEVHAVAGAMGWARPRVTH